MIFFGILAISVIIYIVSFYRFISNSVVENMDKEYFAMANDLNETSQNLFWKLTLTSQQLLENDEIQKDIVIYQEADNLYQKQSYYSALLDQIAILTMSETDIALLYFYDPDNGDLIYSNLPVDRQILSTNYLFTNELFHYWGPTSSQSTILSNPVFILGCSAILPNGNEIYFSIESGYYSLDKQFQNLANKSAFLIFQNEQGQILYNSIPEEKMRTLDTNTLLSGENHDYHVFTQQASQGWSTYVIVPDTIYTSQYQNGLQDFLKYILIFAILLAFLSILFWRSIYYPLQLFNMQIETIVTNEKISGENPSSIPEFDFLFMKIKQLQQQVQRMLSQAVIQEKANTQAQLEKLRAQINPHFLMNTLNTVHWLALMNKQPEIDEITQSLAHLLSYNLDKDSYNTNLQKEIGAVSEYVRLQKVRYQFDFMIKTFPRNSALNYPCPKFILQPFIENALSHGYRENMKIEINISSQKDEIEIEISDSGSGMTAQQLNMVKRLLQPPVAQPTGSYSSVTVFEPELHNAPSVVMNQNSGKGIGLSYVAGILNLYYNEPCLITVNSTPDIGTSFCIHLPKMKGRGYDAENTNH